MPSPEDRLQELGITLPVPPAPVANYVPTVRVGDLLFVAGHGPAQGADGRAPRGKLGQDTTVEQGYEAARLVAVNLLATLKAELGELSRVKQIVKLLVMVNATPDFTETPAVANGCSDLLVDLYGEQGKHARAAVGMSTLPNSIPVEIEMIVELAD